MSTQSTHDYFCFICGLEVIFRPGYYTTNRIGKTVLKRFNTDGSEHICQHTKKQDNHQSNEGQTYNRRTTQRPRTKNANYRGFGVGAHTRRKAEARNQHRQRYAIYNKHNNMSTVEALQILQLSKDVLVLRFDQKVAAIKHAFRTLALRFHPDRIHINPDADEERFREINDAYDILLT